jgi:hypothetical protein
MPSANVLLSFDWSCRMADRVLAGGDQGSLGDIRVGAHLGKLL